MGALATLVTGFVVAGLWIWRHTTSLELDAHEQIEELENDQRSEFAAELADLYTDIESRVEEDDSVPPEMTHEEHVVNTIHREVNEDDVDNIVDELEEIGDSRELYNDHVDQYNQSWERCGYAAGATLALLILFAGAIVTPGDAFSGGLIVAYSVLGMGSLVNAKQAFDSFKRANELRSDFDMRWQEYKKAD